MSEREKWHWRAQLALVVMAYSAAVIGVAIGGLITWYWGIDKRLSMWLCMLAGSAAVNICATVLNLRWWKRAWKK